MKVQGPPKPRMQPIAGQAPGKPNAKEGGAQAATGERVEVSNLSKMLAEARAPGEPDVARVQRLKSAIQAGEFTIDADRIATAMMHEEF